jgi:hypothetical protein
MKFKLFGTIILALAAFVGASSAQDTYVGIDYTRVNPSVRQPHFRFDSATDSVGLVASYTGYETKNLGLTAEGSAVFNGGRATSQLYTALGGLTLKSRYSPSVQPYVSGLAGVGVARVGKTVFGPSNVDSGFAYKLAGGVDIGSGRTKFRLIELGYLRTNLYGQGQNNFVASTGIVF